MRGEKRKMSEELREEKSKRAKVEEKLKSALKDVDKKNQQLGEYKKRFKKMANEVIKQMKKQSPDSRGPSKKKNFSEYTRQHQARIRKQLVKDCESTLSFMGLYDFIATKVDVFNTSTGLYEEVLLVDEGEIDATARTETMTNEEIDEINMMLYVKDKFCISNTAYHEMAMLCKELPRSCKIQDRMKTLNRKWDIRLTPGREGVQQSIEDRLKVRIEALRKNRPEINKVRVKISGDGTFIGKRIHVINVTFTLLEEGNASMAAYGNHTKAILKCKEDYDHLKSELTDIVNDVERLDRININDKDIMIEWFLGGDWKFLATVTGIGAANSDYPCIWCKCKRDQRFDKNIKWSARDLNNGARTIEQIQELSRKRCALKEKFGCKQLPLFHSIPIDHVIIDSLHLFLRIADNLISLLILELRRQEAIDKKKVFHDFDVIRHHSMLRYKKFLNEECNISFDWYVDPETKNLKWRDLNGPEKLILFKKINIRHLLPTFLYADKVQQIWDNFFAINNSLKCKTADAEFLNNLDKDIKSWFSLFLEVYLSKNVTPYMHALLQHVPAFMEWYGGINMFNQQGLEKLNDITTKDFYNSSNHKGTDALVQVLQKKNRLEMLEDLGCKRDGQEQLCGNCRERGHNIKTCTEESKTCQYKPFSSPCHIEKKDGEWVRKCSDQ